MKKWAITGLTALLLAALIATALGVTYNDQGGMIINGDGTDDFSNLQTDDPNVIYNPVILPGDDADPQYDEDGNLITPGPGPTFAPGEVLNVWMVNGDGTEEQVTLVHAGSKYCDVRKGRTQYHVLTSDLRYEIDGSVPESRRFACINAKRTGYATMHTRASAKSDVVNRCTTNQMCLVLSVGRGYTKVWCMGAAGYIKTSSLTFLPGGETEPVDAVMTYKGRTTGRITVNIRQNGKASSRILAEIPCGTMMVICGRTEDGWLEVEAAGWRCFIQEKYATPYDELYNTVIHEADAPVRTPEPQINTQEENTVTTEVLTQIIFHDASAETLAELPEP